MLNAALYKALCKVFGHVLVENEGMHADIVRDYSTGYTTTWRVLGDGSHGEQYRVNCPFCHDRNGPRDTKHHLYISYTSFSRPVVDGVALAQGKLLAHCFRGCLSDPYKYSDLAAMIAGGLACLDENDTNMLLDGHTDTGGTTSQVREYSVSHEPTLDGVRTWAPGFIPCTDYMTSDIEDYLYGRGLDMGTLERFSIGWGQLSQPRTGTLLNGGAPWIIMPIVMNGELKGIQARCPDKFIGENGLRYWIHPGMRKATVAYNIDRARTIGIAVLCEGVFDVLKVGSPGVCCFGHTPSAMQMQLLSSVPQGVVILPDMDSSGGVDTLSKAHTLASALSGMSEFPKGVHVVCLPDKDAGCMCRQDIWSVILEQVPAEMQDFIVKHVLSTL